MTADFYVYEHWRPDTNQCFYVGKGRGNRAYCRRRNPYWKNIVNKLHLAGLDYEVRIVKDNLTQENALTIEIELIAFWRSTVNLTNLTSGGGGLYNPSEEVRAKVSAARKGKQTPIETRNKISAANKGKPPWNKGKCLSDEDRARISIANTGRLLSDETRAKIGAAAKGNNHNLGRKLSKEVRNRISASVKRYFASYAEENV